MQDTLIFLSIHLDKAIDHMNDKSQIIITEQQAHKRILISTLLEIKLIYFFLCVLIRCHLSECI